MAIDIFLYGCLGRRLFVLFPMKFARLFTSSRGCKHNAVRFVLFKEAPKMVMTVVLATIVVMVMVMVLVMVVTEHSCCW